MTTRSVNFNYQLIDLVESNPVLYDMSRVWYKDDTHKQAIWMDIAKTLNESVETCRRRWKSFRTRFRKEFVRIENLKQKAQPCTGTWEYFDRLSFLENHLRPRESSDYAELEKITSKSDQEEETGQMSDCKEEHESENEMSKLALQEKISDVSSASSSRKRKRASSLSDAPTSVTPDILEAPRLVLLPGQTQSGHSSPLTVGVHTTAGDTLENSLYERFASHYGQHDNNKAIRRAGAKPRTSESAGKDKGDCIDAFAQLVVAKMRRLRNTATAEVRIIMVLNEELDKEMSS